MSQQQRAAVDQILRNTWGDSLTSPKGSGLLDLGGDVEEQRRLFAEMMSAIPLPDDIFSEDAALGEVPVITITVDGVEPSGTILYFHGGAYALGSASPAARLASELARRSGTRAVLVDYPLAPENPYPAAVSESVAAYQALLDDGARADDIVLVGESSGGGLALAAIQAAMSAGLPRPAAVYVASPWVDLTMTGASMTTKADADPSVTRAGLRRRARDYAPGHDLTDGRISPVFADLTGLPPLLIQAGGNEVLLDDATRLAAKAASDGVQVTLEVTPDVPHVFQGFAGMLDEADRALDDAGRFIRENLACVKH
jgi:epsilon-lactone hydrolase